MTTKGKGKGKAKRKASATTTRTTTTPAKTTKTTPAKIRAKRFVHTHLSAGDKATVEQLVKLSGSTEGSIRTALTDLKNPKYAIDG